MGRAIVTKADVAKERGVALEAVQPGAPGEADGYLDRLVKYVPAEVIALYLAVQTAVEGLQRGGQRQVGGILVFAIFVAGTWFWLKKTGVARTTQIAISIGAFAVWALATSGGPLAAFDLAADARKWGAVLVPLFTFATAPIEPGR
ncbi:MAG TPA: hypothetical protein VH880_04115 [Anaeromyxobacteraceae bacterium]|jgi:hypothetical protein